jgi:hypothetical protein
MPENRQSSTGHGTKEVTEYIISPDEYLKRQKTEFPNGARYSDRPISVTGFDCFECGAIIQRTAITQHNNYHATFGHRKQADMSQVSWCDPGNHAFKAGIDGSASFEGVNYVDGKPVNARQDVCPKHNPYNATVDIERAITAQANDNN